MSSDSTLGSKPGPRSAKKRASIKTPAIVQLTDDDDEEEDAKAKAADSQPAAARPKGRRRSVKKKGDSGVLIRKAADDSAVIVCDLCSRIFVSQDSINFHKVTEHGGDVAKQKWTGEQKKQEQDGEGAVEKRPKVVVGKLYDETGEVADDESSSSCNSVDKNEDGKREDTKTPKTPSNGLKKANGGAASVTRFVKLKANRSRLIAAFTLFQCGQSLCVRLKVFMQ